MKTNSKINEKRQYLKGLSLPIRSLKSKKGGKA